MAPNPLEGVMVMTRARCRASQDLEECRREGGALGEELQALSGDTVKRARGAAHAAVDALMLSDAPLLFPPGQLALAAMRSGFNKASAVPSLPPATFPP